MIKLITALLITITPSNAAGVSTGKRFTCSQECIQYQADGFGQCANLIQIFTPGSKEYNNMWYACILKLQKTEKYKQCQQLCEPKGSHETPTR